MSEFKTNKISPRKGTTTTIGDSGDTIATGSGTTLNIQGTYSGINAISWDTTAKTADFTAETNRGYFVDTSSASVTVTLPASPVAGSFIGIKDYALTADTNAITIARNGNNIQGTASDVLIQTEGGVANLVYVDATQGWLTFDAAQASDITEDIRYVTATGGTETTCGDYKIHTFTSPGTFCVSCAGNPAGSSTVDYLVLAGGGGSSGANNLNSSYQYSSGGGGAGGYRESSGTASGCYTASPLGACVSALPVSVTAYPITVGAGGSGGPSSVPTVGSSGSNSVFSTITSTGGGNSGIGGDPAVPANPGIPGGSGGGAGAPGSRPAGTGNTPPVSPPQGNPGGTGNSSGDTAAGGGGGAGAAGSNSPSADNGGPGGNGVTSSINASPVTRAGGGGAGAGWAQGGVATAGTGGSGGGANGSVLSPGANGTVNTGGGAGGTSAAAPSGTTGSAKTGGSGGSGIVIIRYKYQ